MSNYIDDGGQLTLEPFKKKRALHKLHHVWKFIEGKGKERIFHFIMVRTKNLNKSLIKIFPLDVVKNWKKRKEKR